MTSEERLEYFMREIRQSNTAFANEMRLRDEQRAAETAALKEEMRQRDEQRAVETAALKEEMRIRDEQRAADIARHENELKEIKSDIRTLNEKIDSRFDGLAAQINNFTLAAAFGAAAVVLAAFIK